MEERRRHPRYKCEIKCHLEYFEGNPNDINIFTVAPIKDEGLILNISQSGLMLVSNLLVTPGMRLRVSFFIRNQTENFLSRIVSTGRRIDNPSDKIRDIADANTKFNNYIAVEFDHIIPELSEQDL